MDYLVIPTAIIHNVHLRREIIWLVVSLATYHVMGVANEILKYANHVHRHLENPAHRAVAEMFGEQSHNIIYMSVSSHGYERRLLAITNRAVTL